MYLVISKNPRKKDRSRGKRKTAKLKAKNRRRVNRMARRSLGRSGSVSRAG
ncbi:MAG: hypothetical protein U0234_11135 [Sandaracinus sp.]